MTVAPWTKHRCSWAQKRVQELLIGVLHRDARRPLARHLLACPSCRAYLREMRHLPGLLASFGEPAVPDGLCDYIKGVCFFLTSMQPRTAARSHSRVLRPSVVCSPRLRLALAGTVAIGVLILAAGVIRLVAGFAQGQALSSAAWSASSVESTTSSPASPSKPITFASVAALLKPPTKAGTTTEFPADHGSPSGPRASDTSSVSKTNSGKRVSHAPHSSAAGSSLGPLAGAGEIGPRRAAPALSRVLPFVGSLQQRVQVSTLPASLANTPPSPKVPSDQLPSAIDTQTLAQNPAAATPAQGMNSSTLREQYFADAVADNAAPLQMTSAVAKVSSPAVWDAVLPSTRRGTF
jgi:hypothetical protein